MMNSCSKSESIIRRTLCAAIVLFVVVFCGYKAEAGASWDKKAFLSLKNTPNEVTWSEWQSLADFEKRALYETRYLKRVDPDIAYAIYRGGNTLLLSVDQPTYFKRRRIVGAINIPSHKFTDSFVRRAAKSLSKYKYIIIYCR